MRKIIFLCASAMLLCLSKDESSAQELPSDSVQKAKSFEKQVTRTVRLDYLLFLPKDYEAKASKKWPLILFLHGAGERGTNVAKVAAHGPLKILKHQPDFPFLVVSPQCPSGERWSNEDLLALLDGVIEDYNVDTKRIYLTGLSMGGFGTWSLGLAHPNRFAAIAPICGGGDVLAILLADPKKARALKSLPVWAFHGAKDEVVKSVESERMVEALKKVGNAAKLTIYPEANHDSWTVTYNNPALYDWFLEHER